MQEIIKFYEHLNVQLQFSVTQSHFHHGLLMVEYKLLQAYKLLSDCFPLPSMFLLPKFRQSNVDAMQAAKALLESAKVFPDVILMLDEIYLQICVQYSGGDFTRYDHDGNIFKGLVVFMI